MSAVVNFPGWATYLRVSDEDKQSPERTFAMQRQRIQEQLLNPSKQPFKREYCDMLTGTSPNRHDYQLMLADAEAVNFSHLGLYRADRFGRHAAEGLQAATKLISLGIKIRVANMPTLTPESPDGFFMFLIQMGLAQREVDVLRIRTQDGMEAKLRAGGWPHKAPEGYINKEKLVSSGKYDRWVEKDPVYNQGIRTAWVLLLTGRYTLEEICEELTRRGFIRSTGRPLAWTDPKTKRRVRAKQRLHKIFHTPFYAGWAVSKRFGVEMGEVRGHWEPTVSTDEFERGLDVLLENGDQKSRFIRQFYFLRNMLWVRVGSRTYKMYGSTPTGRSRSYAYYITQAKPEGQRLHIPCQLIDAQIPLWLRGVNVDPELLPNLRYVYRGQVSEQAHLGRENEIAKAKNKITRLRAEEAKLGRLLITDKISEETYEQLRAEWKDKNRSAQEKLRNLERDFSRYLDDLDMALLLLTQMSTLFDRLDDKAKHTLLQILVNRIIVDPDGKIVDYELNRPFGYLSKLVNDPTIELNGQSGSKQVPFGVLEVENKIAPSELA